MGWPPEHKPNGVRRLLTHAVLLMTPALELVISTLRGVIVKQAISHMISAVLQQ